MEFKVREICMILLNLAKQNQVKENFLFPNLHPNAIWVPFLFAK